MKTQVFSSKLTRLLKFLAPLLMLQGICSCSHNPASVLMGKQIKLGNTEYGEISYINGFYMLDLSRENSSWEIEVSDEDGLSYDPKTGTVKGIRKIKRTIGKQVTGYLVELAEKDPELARKYLLENTQEPNDVQ